MNRGRASFLQQVLSVAAAAPRPVPAPSTEEIDAPVGAPQRCFQNSGIEGDSAVDGAAGVLRVVRYRAV